MYNQEEILAEVNLGTCAVCEADSVEVHTIEVNEIDTIDVCECCNKENDEVELDLDIDDDELFNINTWN